MVRDLVDVAVRLVKDQKKNLVASTLINGAPTTLAIRLAISVLPTPVGPIIKIFFGRDVESMVRDLVDVAVRLVKDQKKGLVKDEAVKGVSSSSSSLLPKFGIAPPSNDSKGLLLFDAFFFMLIKLMKS
jgi:ATP-dependent protease HslVU (ClpYQ) ATPase subunit